MRAIRKSSALGAPSIERGVERFRQVLRDQSLKMSTVRETIARSALACDGHFSAEDLLRTLKNEGVRDAHLATVYRAIPLMVEAGLIQPVLLSRGDGQLYEVIFERDHHDHLICTSCGTVVEYRSEALDALEREIAEEFGFELDEHVHELIGRCSSCRRTARRAVAQISPVTLMKKARPGRWTPKKS
ncbi:MAG: regulator protein family [Labilithrix sp.]|nr:regulator protein family [Labilithrix sp.]